MHQFPTPFEAKGRTEWTTLEEEADFLHALATDTNRVTITVLGDSSPFLHWPIRRVTLDTLNTPANAPTVLFVGLQHGDEPVGREFLLTTIRDLAYTTDPNLTDLLDRVRFHFLPASNPNGFPDHRVVYGAGGLNMNRDHVALQLVETHYVQQTITDTNPFLVVDCHEHYAPNASRRHMEFLVYNHPLIDPGLQTQAERLLQACQARFDQEGITHGLYAPTSNSPQALSNQAGIRDRARLLLETPARDNEVPPATRHDWYLLTGEVILEWLHVNAEIVALEQHHANLRTTRRRTPFDLTNGILLDPAPLAYQLDTVPDHLHIFGLRYAERDGTVTVPVRQPGGKLVPLLFDPQSDYRIAPAQRVQGAASTSMTAPTTMKDVHEIRYQHGNTTIPASQVKLRIDGRVVDVWDRHS